MLTRCSQALRCPSTQIRSRNLKLSCSAQSKWRSDSRTVSIWARNSDQRRSTFSAPVISTFRSTTSHQEQRTAITFSWSTRWRGRTPTAMTTVWHWLCPQRSTVTSMPILCWRIPTLVSSELCPSHSSMMPKLLRLCNRTRHRSSQQRRLRSLSMKIWTVKHHKTREDPCRTTWPSCWLVSHLWPSSGIIGQTWTFL